MLRRLAIASAIVGFTGISTASAESNWLEPEEGVFSEGFEENDLLLLAPLLGDDHYRQCLLVARPSFEPESVVFIRDDDAEPTVVSRTLRSGFWSKRTAAQKNPATNAGSGGEGKRDTPLEQIQAAVETKTARLDRGSADLVMGVCEEVLLRTRYPGERTGGFDGATYHAAHRGHGTFLSGKVWSPQRGTVAYDFVEMENMLAAFVVAPAAQREAQKAALLTKAKDLLKRVRETPPTDAAAANSAGRALELVALLIKGVASGRDPSRMAGDLNAMLSDTKTTNRWKVTTDIPGIRISLGARSIRGNATEAILYTDVIARLSLDDLQRRFGSYSVVHEGNTSSVRFTAMPAHVTMSADLLDSKVNPQSVVQTVTIRPALKRD